MDLPVIYTFAKICCDILRTEREREREVMMIGDTGKSDNEWITGSWDESDRRSMTSMKPIED